MKVYILGYYESCEGWDILGIFKTKESAEKARDAEPWRSWQVEEFDVKE